MTQRDQKTLLILLASVGGVGVAFWFLYSLFLSPRFRAYYSADPATVGWKGGRGSERATGHQCHS